MDEQLIQWAIENKGILAASSAAYATGFASAIVVPPADIAVYLFRLSMKFPPFRAAVRKNPEAVKKAIDAVEQALDIEIEAVAGEAEKK